jgi:hypothetical protein
MIHLASLHYLEMTEAENERLSSRFPIWHQLNSSLDTLDLRAQL